MYLLLAFDTVALVNDDTKRLALIMVAVDDALARAWHGRRGLSSMIRPRRHVEHLCRSDGPARDRQGIALLVDAEPQLAAWQI